MGQELKRSSGGLQKRHKDSTLTIKRLLLEVIKIAEAESGGKRGGSKQERSTAHLTAVLPHLRRIHLESTHTYRTTQLSPPELYDAPPATYIKSQSQAKESKDIADSTPLTEYLTKQTSRSGAETEEKERKRRETNSTDVLLPDPETQTDLADCNRSGSRDCQSKSTRVPKAPR